MHTYKTYRGTKRIIPLTETEQQVADYLKAKGIDFTVLSMGSGKELSGTSIWEYDRWLPKFSRGTRGPLEQEYKTGLGHRVGPVMPAEVRKANQRSLYVDDWIKTNVRPYPPSAASVLHSLLSDARLGSDNTFDQFCDELGYDTDSRRALESYLQCQSIGQRMVHLFERDEIEHLTALLEDY